MNIDVTRREWAVTQGFVPTGSPQAAAAFPGDSGIRVGSGRTAARAQWRAEPGAGGAVPGPMTVQGPCGSSLGFHGQKS